MGTNPYMPIDLSTKSELINLSNPHNSTRVYTVKLKQNWDPQCPPDEVASGSALTSPFRKGQYVVMKQFVAGPEVEKMALATTRCEKEYNKLYELNGLQKKKNFFVMVLGISMNMDIGGPFILLEQGNCSLGHLLHKRKTDCPTEDGSLSGTVEIEERKNHYTSDHCFTFIVQIFEALEFLHKEYMMHRDLKSYNVLLFNEMTLCKLCDFEDCRNVDPGNTQMTAKMGTTWWRAPEMYRNISEGKAEYNLSAEWYSFGLVMCELLFREEPFMCYYAGQMSDRPLDPSRVFSDPFLAALPKKDEVDIDKYAMHFDTLASPTFPPVVLNKEKCVFTDAKELPMVWSLIDDLLRWKPEDRPKGEKLRERVQLHIASCSSGSPPKISIPSTMETDTGGSTNKNHPSFKPVVSVKKVRFQLSRVIQEKDRETIVDQCKEVASGILKNVNFTFNILSGNEYLRLTLSGKNSVFVSEVHDYCMNNSQFSNALSAKFRFCSNERIKELEFTANRTPSVSPQRESKLASDT